MAFTCWWPESSSCSAGYLWLLVRAWGHDWRWGLALILFPPATLLFMAREFRRVVVPANILLVGLLLVLGTVGVNLVLVPSHRSRPP